MVNKENPVPGSSVERKRRASLPCFQCNVVTALVKGSRLKLGAHSQRKILDPRNQKGLYIRNYIHPES